MRSVPPTLALPFRSAPTVALVATLLLASCGGSNPAVAPGLVADGDQRYVAEFHMWHDVRAQNPDGTINVVVEIPAGTSEKWEVDAEDGSLRWDTVDGAPRVVAYLAYPANYGMVPRTLQSASEGGDGDPLDVFVLGAAVPRGSVVPARLIGVVRLEDSGEIDDKLVAVPRSGPFASVRDIDELEARYPGALEILTLWLGNYKGPGIAMIGAVEGADAAAAALDGAVRAYEAAFPGE
jgi:inorganic pyrophosphatase